MDIHSAAHYLKNGYRIRRPDWESGEYIFPLEGMLYSRWHEHHGHSEGIWNPELGDLLANDWELLIDEDDNP